MSGQAAGPGFVARRYRYANGVAYNPNRYDILQVVDEGPDGPTPRHLVGGALVTGGKAIAWAGHGPGGGYPNVAGIVAHSTHHAWADTLPEALAKIRPFLQTRA